MQVAEGPRRPALGDEFVARPRGRATARARTRRHGAWAWRLAMSLLVAATGAVAALTLGPRFLPYETHPVIGRSMEPAIPYGSVAVFRPVEGGELGVGDVIVFEHPEISGQLVTHRIVGIEERPGGRVAQTQGDANDMPDPWEIRADGEGARYAFSVPLVGYLLSFLQTASGRLGLIVVSSVLLGAWALLLIWWPRSPEGGPVG